MVEDNRRVSTLRWIAAWAGALLIVLLRLTCRRRLLTADPRIALHESGTGFTFALLHAHQLAAIFYNDERRMRAMVSRSTDGDFLVPVLRLRRVEAVRGSTRTRTGYKGGREALARLKEGVLEGIPALIAVDGPLGPRNSVHRGIAELAIATGRPVVCAAIIPSSRWFLRRTWDRFQIPKPFCRLQMSFAPLIEPNGDDVEALRGRILEMLNRLERQADPGEAQRAGNSG